MSASTAPLFGPVAGVEYPDLKKPGVWLTVRNCRRPDGTATLRVTGYWQCATEQLAKLPEPPHRAVAILVIAGPDLLPFSFSAQGGGIAFPDDVHELANQSRGYFDCDAFVHADLPPQPGRYLVSASFAGHLSPVCEAVLT